MGIPLIIILLISFSYLLCLILGESEIWWALLSKVGYSGTTRAIFILYSKVTGCSGGLVLVPFFAVKAMNGDLLQEVLCMFMEEGGPSNPGPSAPASPTDSWFAGAERAMQKILAPAEQAAAPHPNPEQGNPPLAQEDQTLESHLRRLGPDQLCEWITSREFAIEDQLNQLRKQEGMRPLGALRGEQIILHFEEKYGSPAALDRILRSLEQEGLASPYYAESKIEKSLPTEAELRRIDRDVTRKI
jgi:hypothetical protein